MLDSLLILFVAIHLLAVGVAIGGPFVCIYLRWCERVQSDLPAALLGQWLSWTAVISLLFGLIPGGLALALLWHSYPAAYFGALSQIDSSRYWLALPEWIFSLALLVAYAALWRRGATRPVWHSLLSIVGGSNLAYHFPALFAAVAVLSTRSETWHGNTPFRTMLIDPEFLARFTHDLLASFAATGVMLMTFALRARRLGHDPAVQSRAILLGGRVALIAVILQLLVGVWLLVQLNPESRTRLLGQDLLAAGCFGAALLATIALLNLSVSAALGDDNLSGVRRSMICLALVFLGMVAARHRARLPEFQRIEQAPSTEQRSFNDQAWENLYAFAKRATAG